GDRRTYSKNRLLRLENLGTTLRQLPNSCLRADGTGGTRILRDDVRPRDCPSPYSRTGHRIGTGRTRRFNYLFATPGAVQTAHCRVPTHSLQAGRDGGEYRGGAATDVLRCD